MEDIPQPSDEPYSVGDRVRIYIEDSDYDSRYHGVVCEVTEVLADNLDAETGRVTDRYSYQLEHSETEESIPVTFRHRDLVPAESP